jgi:hypothetical protein
MKFRQRQVADPRAQQNFEQLESFTDVLGRTYRVGPIAGNNAAMSTVAAALPGLAVTFTTPKIRTRARIDHQVRLDTAVGAWNFGYVGIGISPVPLVKHHTNQVAGGAIGNQTSTALLFLHNAGQSSAHWVGWDYAELEVSTTYTVQVYGGGSGSALSWNSAVAESSLMVALQPL